MRLSGTYETSEAHDRLNEFKPNLKIHQVISALIPQSYNLEILYLKPHLFYTTLYLCTVLTVIRPDWMSCSRICSADICTGFEGNAKLREFKFVTFKAAVTAFYLDSCNWSLLAPISQVKQMLLKIWETINDLVVVLKRTCQKLWNTTWYLGLMKVGKFIVCGRKKRAG